MHKRAGQAICDAWVNKDYGLLRGWLADPLEWHEGSYDEPIVSASDVVARWESDVAKQTNVRVSVELLDVMGSHSYHHCVASWLDSERGDVSLDGIFMIGLNEQGKICLFRQWWNRVAIP